MTDERKYGEAEVREILDLAANEADVPHRAMISDENGLTLSELQEVGREVGMAPARIAEAAGALEARRGGLPRETYMRAPVGVGRIVQLPRGLTDHEWDVLVGELRETFGARGTVTSHGGVREWANGNLHVFLEPTATGHRLRMGTVKGTAVPMMRTGLTGLVVGLLLLTLFIGEQLPPAAAVASLITLTGGGILGSSLLRLPRWAGEREGQMEYIAGRVIALVGEPVET